MELVTWNLDGLEPRKLDERTEAACLETLLAPEGPPDVVVLQEVVQRSLMAHLRHHFGHAGYSLMRQPADSEYYCVIFSRLPVKAARAHRFPGTIMGRALLAVEVDVGGVVWRIGTAHLESLREGGKQRVKQANHVARWLRGWSGPAVFAGDTNLRDSELKKIDTTDVVDAWEAMGRPSDSAYTWDLKRNVNLPVRGDRPPRFRFDRVWCKGCTPSALRLTGETVTNGVMPSDHFGIRVSLS